MNNHNNNTTTTITNSYCSFQIPSLCLQCARDEMTKNKRIIKLTKFFKNFSNLKNEEGLVLPISSIYRTNIKSISFEEYLESGLIECLLKILKNHVPHDEKFLSKDQNFYLPFYILEILLKSLSFEKSFQIIEKNEGIEIFLYLLSNSGQYSWICSLSILKILNLFNKFHHVGLTKILKKQKEIFSIFKFGLYSNEIIFQRYFQFESRKNWVQNILKIELLSSNQNNFNFEEENITISTTNENKEEEEEKENEILNEIVFKKIEMIKYCSFDILSNLEINLIFFLIEDYFKNFNFFLKMCYSTSSLCQFLSLGIKFLNLNLEKGSEIFIQYSVEILNSLKFLLKTYSFKNQIKFKSLEFLEIILKKFEFDLLIILLEEEVEEIEEIEENDVKEDKLEEKEVKKEKKFNFNFKNLISKFTK